MERPDYGVMQRQMAADRLADDAQVIAFEAQWPKHNGRKERAMRETFAVGPARYYQRVDLALDSQEALTLDPITVNRLLRLREERKLARDAAVLGKRR